MDLRTITLPPLLYPFESRICPYVDTVEAMVFEWMDKEYESTMSDTLKKFRHRDTLCAHFAARMYPNSNLEVLITLSRFLQWGLVNDDYFEYHDVPQLAWVRQHYFDIIVNRRQPYPNDLEVFHQIALIRDDVIRVLPEAWLTRFGEAMHKYVTGMMQEVPYKKLMLWPTVEEYTEIRQSAVCVYPLFAFLELECGSILPDHIYYSAAFQRLADLFCRILAWTNDYFSIRKEKDNDVMNIILICQHHLNCSMEEAYRQAVAIHDRDVAEAIAIINGLPDFGVYNGAVKKFLENYCLLLPGQRDWYIYDTNRYPLVVERTGD